jgi:hypothetical protein
MFSDDLTILAGENGAGKTPMLKGLAYCLGYPIQLPPEIIIHCTSILLELYNDDRLVRLERKIQLEFSAFIESGDELEEYDDIKTFSARICSLLGIQERSFAAKNDSVTGFYMSFLVPIFWIDQDLGWKDLYCPLHNQNFVKDQMEEIVRLLFGLPGKNRATDKNEYATAIIREGAAKERVAIKREVLRSMEASLARYGRALSAAEITTRKLSLAREIRETASALDAISSQSSTFDEKISSLRSEYEMSIFAQKSTDRRLDELRSYGATLSTQVSVVEANEIAADAFRVLCGNDSCQYFRNPEESYGRRVLYIKDQIKDFETSMRALIKESVGIKARTDSTERRLQQAIKEKAVKVQALSGNMIVEDLDRATQEYAEISAQLIERERYETESAELRKLIDAAVAAEEIVRNLKPTRGAARDETAAWDAANDLGVLFISWLDTLHTPNLPKQIWFDEHFALYLGGINFTEDAPFGGSTRTRIVLAFHAALIELSLKHGGHHPEFLILDTPKQHELHSRDLRAFVTRFMNMRSLYNANIQLVIAATELDFLEDISATIWHPYYLIGDEPRYFGHYLPSFAEAYQQEAGKTDNSV